jgi:hypothetical protein
MSALQRWSWARTQISEMLSAHAARRKLRTHVDVLATLEVLWCTTCRGGDGKLSFPRWVGIRVMLARILSNVKATFDEKPAKETAVEEFYAVFAEHHIARLMQHTGGSGGGGSKNVDAPPLLRPASHTLSPLTSLRKLGTVAEKAPMRTRRGSRSPLSTSPSSSSSSSLLSSSSSSTSLSRRRLSTTRRPSLKHTGSIEKGGDVVTADAALSHGLHGHATLAAAAGGGVVVVDSDDFATVFGGLRIGRHHFFHLMSTLCGRRSFT